MLRQLYHNYVPYSTRILVSKYRNKQYRQYINYCRKNYNKFNDEQKQIYLYVKSRIFSIFPYEFTDTYKDRNQKIYRDSKYCMNFLVENDKKMYFKKGMSEIECMNYFNSVSMERDYQSPHRYLSDNSYMIGVQTNNLIHCEALTPPEYLFDINRNDTVFDIGVAEGNFALSIVDKAAKIYLFECDKEWLEALECTFKDYSQKVEIINKFVSDEDNADSITLDSFFSSKKTDVNFVKMDIEGYEAKALLGAANLIKNSRNLKLAVCIYHKAYDDVRISEILTSHGYNVDFTKGYMLFTLDKDFNKQIFRKAVARAYRTNSMEVKNE